MPSSTVNICVLALVLLSIQRICHCRPHRGERGLRVKDYFQPDTLIFSSDKFEKGEDGKYYLKKSAYRSDSEVKYSSPESGENSLEDDAKSGGDAAETATGISGDVQPGGNAKSEPLKEEVTEKVSSEVPLTSSIAEEVKVTGEIRNSAKPATSVIEGVAKTVEGNNDKAPFTPTDPKVPAKPDSKDEVPLKTDLPPMNVEEKVADKIAIGQVPDLYSRLVPVPGTFRMPVLIPIRQVSYGSVKVLPLPPADVSDRLPLPYEDDIIGEGAHESESEIVSQPISEEKKGVVGYHLGNPLAIGMPLPALNFQGFLKDITEANQQNSEKQSKVVDVLGKKFLMQSNVMKYPSGDNSHMFLRFLSMKPLEESKAKEIGAREDMARKNSKELEMKKEEAAAREVLKKEESKVESELKKEESLLDSEMKKEGLLKEEEVLKAEETMTKVNVEEEVPKEVMGGPEVKIQESAVKDGKSLGDGTDEMKIHAMEHPLVATDEKTEGALEKAESQVVEMKAVKDESISEEYEEELIKKDMMEEKSASGEADDLLKKEHAEKEMEMANKKDYFQTEKTKKGKFMEGEEKVKLKKKTEKKRKCKCEDDSDDDEE